MSTVTSDLSSVTVIGLDLAKLVFQANRQHSPNVRAFIEQARATIPPVLLHQMPIGDT